MRTAGRARRHAARLGDSVSSPADLWLLVRMLGWSLVLPLAKRVLPLSRLVHLMRPRTGTRTRHRNRQDAIASLAAWVFKTRPPGTRDNCLERGLVTFRYLSRAGAEPVLVIGMAKGSEGVHGHVWVTVDGRPVHDSPEALAGFEPFLVFESESR